MIAIPLLALLQAATSPVAVPDTQGPPLWRDLREGMMPEQFAEVVRKIDGVKSVEAVRRKGKSPKIKITYVIGGGVAIGTMTVEILPTFSDDRLKTVALSQTTCVSTATSQLTTTLSALSEKYPKNQRIKVVDEQGVPLDTQRAFYNDETRVTVSVKPVDNPYPRHVYGGSGLVASLNKLANSLADQAYNNAIAACPNDGGRKAVVILEYSSQTQFAAEHARDEADREAKARATKDGL